MIHRSRLARVSLAPTIVLAVMLSALMFSVPDSVAAAPATVTVRVEGFTGTLLALTQVTTTTTPVSKDGKNSCTGTSALGALDDATHANWVGQWDGPGLGYEVDGIQGANFPPFSASPPPDAFWYEWVNNAPGNGACADELAAGAQVLFFSQCSSSGPDCAHGASSPDPLSMSAPATAQSGTPFTVTVTAYDNATGKPSPANGATVSAGSASATTNAQGTATLTIPATGTFAIAASGPNFVRSETHSLCVHNGDDGTCGAPAPPGAPPPPTAPSPTVPPPVPPPHPYSGPFAVVANASGPKDGHVYSRRRAPRLLTGTVTAHTAIAWVSIRLRRSFRGRCYAYSGTSARFYVAHCGQGSFFEVGAGASFSYLLPAPVGPGRYVYDIAARDAAGNQTLLSRGTSRVIFYVR